MDCDAIQTAAAPATVSGEGLASHWRKLGRAKSAKGNLGIRKPGDLPAPVTLTGRGVPVSGLRMMPALLALVPPERRDMMTMEPVEVLVCSTCRAGMPTDMEGSRPGAQLAEALLAKEWPAHVTVKTTECLSNCDSGCSVAVRGGADRWTYVYGNFTGAEDADLAHEGLVKYAGTEDGLVPWRERPVHFRKNCIARIPPLRLPE